MSVQEILLNILSKRDYSGSESDEYAQFISTLLLHLGDGIYSLLEQAETENKKLSLKSEVISSNVIIDEYTLSDVIFI